MLIAENTGLDLFIVCCQTMELVEDTMNATSEVGVEVGVQRLAGECIST